jgi:hypothetical protein
MSVLCFFVGQLWMNPGSELPSVKKDARKHGIKHPTNVG